VVVVLNGGDGGGARMRTTKPHTTTLSE